MRIKYPFSCSFLDYPTKEDSCLSIYFMGCNHKCEGCQNLEFGDPNYIEGTIDLSPNDLVNYIEKDIKKTNSNKITLLGGDPLYDMNFLKEFLSFIPKIYEICIYTGYNIDEIKDLKGFKFIKTGKYIKHLDQKSEKTDSYIKFSTSNQKLYNEQLVLLSQGGIYYF